MSDLAIDTEEEDDEITFVPYGQMNESVRATYLKLMAMEEAATKVSANEKTKSACPQF